MQRLLGAHVSTAGGVSKAIPFAQALGFTAIQIFAKNNNQWMSKPLSAKEKECFHQARETSSLGCIFSHAGYLINLASPDADIAEKSFLSMRQELERAHELRLPFVVLHPGAHKGEGEERGIARIVESSRRLFDATSTSSVKIAFEITAGQGTSLGHRFEHLAEILHRIDMPERIGVCFDTAHAFAAGYDFRTEASYHKMWAEFQRVVDRKWLLAIHLNDSKKELGTRVDRHEHIGKGCIGLPAFCFLMRDKTLSHLPMVLETPKENDPATYDRANMEILKKYIC